MFYKNLNNVLYDKFKIFRKDWKLSSWFFLLGSIFYFDLSIFYYIKFF